jgi:hypothetical protein
MVVEEKGVGANRIEKWRRMENKNEKNKKKR